MTVQRHLLHTVKSAPAPISKDFQSSKSCCLLVLKTNAPTRASRPRMIENLDADAVLNPTASGLPLRSSWRVSAIKSFFMVRSDTMVFSRLVDREPKPARLKARSQVGGGPLRAKPDPALQTTAESFFRASHTMRLTDANFGSPHTNAIHSSPSTMPRQLASQSSTGLLPAT